MRLIVFGGTTEGRLLSCEMARLGAAVTVCVATEYGKEEQGEQPGVEVLVRLGHHHGRPHLLEQGRDLQGGLEVV